MKDASFICRRSFGALARASRRQSSAKVLALPADHIDALVHGLCEHRLTGEVVRGYVRGGAS